VPVNYLQFHCNSAWLGVFKLHGPPGPRATMNLSRRRRLFWPHTVSQFTIFHPRCAPHQDPKVVFLQVCESCALQGGQLAIAAKPLANFTRPPESGRSTLIPRSPSRCEALGLRPPSCGDVSCPLSTSIGLACSGASLQFCLVFFWVLLPCQDKTLAEPRHYPGPGLNSASAAQLPQLCNYCSLRQAVSSMGTAGDLRLTALPFVDAPQHRHVWLWLPRRWRCCTDSAGLASCKITTAESAHRIPRTCTCLTPLLGADLT